MYRSSSLTVTEIKVKKWLYSVVIAAIMVPLGCKTVHVDQSLTQTLGDNDPDTQMEFWHSLNDQPVTSNDDALHALLLYEDGLDPFDDYVDRVQIFKDRGWLPQEFDQSPQQGIQRGTLAVILVNQMGMRGGVTMHLFGPIPRYAVRELVYLGIYPTSSPHQPFSGQQFISVMGRLEDYQRLRQADLHATKLPDEAQP